jgi:hypothetical protein
MALKPAGAKSLQCDLEVKAQAWSWSVPEGPGFEGTPATAVLGSFVLNRFGQLALAQIEEGKCRIVGIEPSGRQRVLDSGPASQLPPASLQLKGHTVQWVDAGITHSATI